MNRPLALVTLIAALAAPLSAQADRAWMLASSISLSGDKEWITIDAGISDNLFVADHAAMRLDGLAVTAPDGTEVTPENQLQGRYRSTFDIHLNQAGTYRIANVMTGMNATYVLDGHEQRWWGSAAQFPAALPAGATAIRASVNNHRIETFVTLGAPTRTVFTPTGKGLELVPVTHPGDVAVGETASFTLLNDGQPAPGLKVSIGRGAARYRDALEDIETVTDAAGAFTVTWPEAGMYWLTSSIRTPPQGDTIGVNTQYSGVVEVLP